MLGPGLIVGNPLDAGFRAVVILPSTFSRSDQDRRSDTDSSSSTPNFRKAPHELRERNSAYVNEMAGRASQPVIYISDVSIYGIHQGLRNSLAEHHGYAGTDAAVGAIKELIDCRPAKEVPDIASARRLPPAERWEVLRAQVLRSTRSRRKRCSSFTDPGLAMKRSRWTSATPLRSPRERFPVVCESRLQR